MSKKIFIVSSTPRKNGNSDILAEEFARGAREAGHSVEKICLREIELKFCTGCMYCHTRGTCVIKDGVETLLPRIADSDVLVFATPVYYYEMSGQMKTMIDRANSLYDSDYKFTDIYMLTTAAEDEPEVPNRAIGGLTGWIDCFDRAHLSGSVFAGGVNESGTIKGHSALKKAYEMGNCIK